MSDNRSFTYSKNIICSKWKFILFNFFLTYLFFKLRCWLILLLLWWFCFLWNFVASVQTAILFLHCCLRSQLHVTLHPQCPARRAEQCWQLLTNCRNPGQRRLLSTRKGELISFFTISEIRSGPGSWRVCACKCKRRLQWVICKWRWLKHSGRTIPCQSSGWRVHFCPRLGVFHDCTYFIECLFRRKGGKRFQRYYWA